MLSLTRTMAISAAVLAASSASAHDFRAGDTKIGHPWTRATPPATKVGGGYLTLTNEGSATDRLHGGSSLAAGRVEIRTMEMIDDVLKMRPIPDGVEIPASQTVELAPGGYHLMPIDLMAPTKEGDAIPVTLQFEKAGAVEVELIAGPLGSSQPNHSTTEPSANEGHDRCAA
jgi:periplasmic copper chaperone A